MTIKYEYDKAALKATVCGVIDCGANVVIPATVEYYNKVYKVKSIEKKAFYNCKALESIVIPNSVTSIGENAFECCSSLTSVTIPNSVTSIRIGAFFRCSSLTSVTIPNSVTAIGNAAFFGCSSLTSVTIPNSVTSIGKYAFECCSSLESIKVETGNTVYDSRNNCNAIIETATNTLITGFKNTVIPNSVTNIGENAFEYCRSLTSVTIPNSVTGIGKLAFKGCSSLTSVTIPNSVTSIGESAFEDCSCLTSVTIPNSVTSIRYFTFLGCSSLTSVTIPNSVTAIRGCAFSKCSSLTSVTIPNSVTTIASDAFENCSSLKTVINYSNLRLIKGSSDCGYVAYYAEKVINAPDGSVEGDFMFGIINGVNTLCGYLGNKTSIVLPESCKWGNYAIGNRVFQDRTGLTSVTIPNSVTNIGENAFEYCRSLTSVTIPNSVTGIGKLAFKGCSSLTSVTIPNSVTSIGENAFEYCRSLTSVTIPNSVTGIGKLAFKGCSSLTSVTIPNSVTSIGESAFEDCKSLKQVDICNEIGELLIHSEAFDDDVKINYLGKKTVNKTTEVKKTEVAPAQIKEQTPVIDLDKLMDAVVVDGVITDKERSVILKKATAAGYDADEVEILLDAKLAEKLNANKATAAEPQKKVEPAKKETAPVAKDAASEEKSGNGARDYSKYSVNGTGSYGKGRMVEAVVNKYVELNPNVTVQKLKEVFPERLQGSNFIKDSTETITDMKRYYESALPGGAKFYISNQWGTQTDAFVEYVNKDIDGITVSKL